LKLNLEILGLKTSPIKEGSWTHSRAQILYLQEIGQQIFYPNFYKQEIDSLQSFSRSTACDKQAFYQIQQLKKSLGIVRSHQSCLSKKNPENFLYPSCPYLQNPVYFIRSLRNFYKEFEK
jgi:hypothetical protein